MGINDIEYGQIGDGMTCFQPMGGGVTGAPKVATGYGSPVTVFSVVLGTNSADAIGYSWRNVTGALSGTGPWDQIRVRFVASTAGGMAAENVSVGIRSGSTGATTAAPVELLFTGASGFSIGAGTTITSDWANLAFTNTDELLVIWDSVSVNSLCRYNNSTARYYKTSATYNVQSPSGLSSDTSSPFGFNLIEARAAI